MPMRIPEDSQGGVLFFGAILLLILFFWLFSFEDKALGIGAVIITVFIIALLGWNDKEKKEQFIRNTKFEESNQKTVEEALSKVKISIDGQSADINRLFQMASGYGYEGDMLNLKGAGSISASKGMISTFHGAVDTLREKGHVVETSMN